MSLGRAWVHDLKHKLEQASAVGFQGVEIFYEDLEYQAKTYGEASEDNLLRVATEIGELCTQLGLTIIALQPFLFYEGLTDRTEHEAKIEKMKLWFKLAHRLGTSTIQIPSSFLPAGKGVTGDIDRIVRDMIEIADLGEQEDPPIRFAYENLAWGTYVNKWEELWEIVSRVNRPNFGMCLDAYNIAGRVWADPTTESGTIGPNADADLKDSLDRMVKTIDVTKVFYLQASDGERLVRPLLEGHPWHSDEQPARMSWSRNARLFVYETEKGGYMPVIEVLRRIINELGYYGWISMELFSRTMTESHPNVPLSHAQRGFTSWEKLKRELDL
jgi:4-hydroxyphenylpyruvate dioxygenase